MQRYLRNGDIVSGAVMAALGTYIIIQASVWPYYSVDGPGPGFFPLWYGIIMVALALGLIVQTARKPQTEPSKMDATGVKRALVVWAAFAISLVLMGYLGFCIAFALFCIFLVCWVLGKPLVNGVLTGVLGAAGFYLLFAVVLGVQLPTGYFGF